ncbi:MAG: hypothetical protein GC201_16405 [Alphaproteobacteria bacterium]|nr:hypothetical protein [Alphaproteobacteria bacterium]
MPNPGTTMAYRPVPEDFEETFIRVGWTSIEAECRAHAKTIARWIDEVGRDDLIRRRAEYVRRERIRRRSDRARRRARNQTENKR